MSYNSYQIAEIIGVNVSTIKRWTDSGKLNCQQTVGGHRKFYLNHLTKFLKENSRYNSKVNLDLLIGKKQSLVDAIDAKDFIYLINHLYRILISGKQSEFITVSNSMILKGYTLDILFDEIIIPILEKIGFQWSKGKLTISEEHLATVIIRKFLSSLTLEKVVNNAKYNAFCFTLTDDRHDLPLHLAESILNQNDKIKIFNLGPNLPVEDFITLSQKTNPEIIYVSIIYIDNLDLINQQVNLMCEYFLDTKTKIFLSGIGLKKIKLTHNNYIQIKSYKDFNKITSSFT